MERTIKSRNSIEYRDTCSLYVSWYKNVLYRPTLILPTHIDSKREHNKHQTVSVCYTDYRVRDYVLQRSSGVPSKFFVCCVILGSCFRPCLAQVQRNVCNVTQPNNGSKQSKKKSVELLKKKMAAAILYTGGTLSRWPFVLVAVILLSIYWRM